MNEPGISDEERAARRQRNREREAERERRRQAQEDAESEVIDREFTCDNSCDYFDEQVSDAMRDGTDLNLDLLKERWNDFLKEEGEEVMPALQAELSRLQ
jgi:hypothetical protein